MTFTITGTSNGETTHTLKATSNAEANAMVKGLHAALGTTHQFTITDDDVKTVDASGHIILSAGEGVHANILKLRADYNAAEKAQKDARKALEVIGSHIHQVLKGADIIVTRRGGLERWRIYSAGYAPHVGEEGQVYFTFQAIPFTKTGTVSKTGRAEYFEAVINAEGQIMPPDDNQKLKRYSTSSVTWKLVKTPEIKAGA